MGKDTSVGTGGVKEAMGLLVMSHCLEDVRAESDGEGWQDRRAVTKKFSPGDKRRDGHSGPSLERCIHERGGEKEIHTEGNGLWNPGWDKVTRG